MSGPVFAQPKKENTTSFSPVLGKKSDRTSNPKSANDGHDMINPDFGYNFSNVRVESDQPFKQSCPLALSSSTDFPFGDACDTFPARIQTKLIVGQRGDEYEQEADRVAEQVMRMSESQPVHKTRISGPDRASYANEPRSATHPATLSAVPPIVHEVLRSPGQQLAPATRAFMESRFEHDFRDVRVHTDARAAESARAVSAQAYTVGREVVFGSQCRSGTDRQLLAHELAHVVQQDRTGSGARIEDKADAAGALLTEDYSVPGGLIGGAPVGLYRQAKEEEKKPGKKTGGEIKLDVPPEKIAPKPPLIPPTTGPKGEPKEPEMPSRIPIPWLSKGRFSLGLRLGFPELSKGTEMQKMLLSGAPDPIKESLQRAKIIDQTLTGKVPTGWEETNKGQLAKAMWGIFSKNLAPDVARKITSGLSASTGAGGLSYELDLVLLTDFSKEIGGGASFTVRW